MSIQLQASDKFKKAQAERLSHSRFISNQKKTQSKLSQYQTNLQNYIQNAKQANQKIDPKGILADSVYVSFSGTVQSFEFFSSRDQDLQITYEFKYNSEWHDQTPEVSVRFSSSQDTSGNSTFCSSKDGKITFSLGFDTLLSCMYIQSWPQLILTVRSFDADGDVIVRGYAQIMLPITSGMHTKEAAVYQIVRNVKWYHDWLPFLQPTYISYDAKDYQRVIQKGLDRQAQKIRCIGKVKIRAQVMLRNFNRFGYR